MVDFQEPLTLPLAILVLLSVVCLWVYRRTNPVLPWPIKTALVLLRILVLLLLVAVLIRPLFGLSYVSKLSPEIAVLVDNSASMKLEDATKSRAEVLDLLLASGIWKELQKKAQVSFFSFSDSLRKTSSEPGQLDFAGKSTSLSTALLQLQKKSPELSLAIILSDGGHNSGPDPGSVAGQLDFPLYTIGVGSDQIPLDLAISDLEYPPEVYLGTPAVIKLSVSGSGGLDQKLKLAITEDGKTVEEREIAISGSGRKQSVRVELTPQAEGVNRYQVSLPKLEGEITHQNNQRKFSLRVEKERLKVLGVAGNLTWEYHFLKRFLDSQENLDKSYVVFDNLRPLEGRFPKNLSELGAYDLLVFVNPGSELFLGKEKLLEEFVLSQGRPILFILDDNFISLARSRLKLKILPFEPADLSVDYSQFNIFLAEPTETSPILRLSPDREENQKLWQDLPPLLGCLVPQDVKQGARVLATYPSTQATDGSPALLVQEFGRGKVMTTLAFPWWRWDFLLAGLEGKSPVYSKFWSNSLRWLTAQKKDKGLELVTDQLVYQAGEKVNFKATYRDELGDKLVGGEMRLQVRNITTASKSDLVLNPDQEKDYIGHLSYLEPGDYLAEAFYSSSGKILGRARNEFQVEEYSLEDQSLTLNRQLLTQLAELSGGRFYTPTDCQKLIEDLVLKERVVERHKSWEVWNQPGILILAVMLLSLEWYWRRRQQLP